VTVEKVNIAELVEDMDFYPRHSVDGAHVLDLMRAIAANETLPPPVADRKSMRIVDGWHRIRAYAKLHGPSVLIDVDLRSYRSDTEILKDAIRLNASHGRKLDQQDRTRSVLLLQRRNVDVKTIAVVLHTTQQRVEQLKLRFALVKNNGSSEQLPVKPNLYPKPGEEPRTLTPEQYAVAQASSGHRTTQILTQLANELEAELWNVDDELIRERAWRLADLIAQRIPQPEPAA